MNSLDGMDLEFEDEERPAPERDPDALMQYLRAGAVAEVESVTGRDGVERPVVLVDFEPLVRGCLYRLAPALAHEPIVATGFDLMRLDLAVQALAQQQARTKVLVPVSWPVVADPECRPALDRQIAPRLGKVRGRVSCLPSLACRVC